MKFLLACLFFITSYSFASIQENNFEREITIHLHVNPEFYNEGLIEIDGHIYRAILLQHHKSCPCFQNDVKMEMEQE